MVYTCKTCGAFAEYPGHLCDPCDDPAECAFCGLPEVDTKHMCKDKLAAMRYVCLGCGRLSMNKRHVCKAERIR